MPAPDENGKGIPTEQGANPPPSQPPATPQEIFPGRKLRMAAQHLPPKIPVLPPLNLLNHTDKTTNKAGKSPNSFIVPWITVDSTKFSS